MVANRRLMNITMNSRNCNVRDRRRVGNDQAFSVFLNMCGRRLRNSHNIGQTRELDQKLSLLQEPCKNPVSG